MKRVVVSLGGSLIVPSAINSSFLRAFKNVVDRYKKTHQFIIICGGGATARAYDSAAQSIVSCTEHERDWIGVHATWLNAQLVKTVLRADIRQVHDSLSKKQVVVLTDKVRKTTSDGVAVAAAVRYKTSVVVNLTNVDYVYTKDPRTHADAKPLADLTWKMYFTIIPKKRVPHMHVPFDPSAAALAAKKGMSVISLKGTQAFDNYLAGKSWKGTVMHP